MAPLAPTIGITEPGSMAACARAADDARGQVEQQEAPVAELVLDVVAENPEIEQVAGRVPEAAVHEHRSEHRQHREVGRNEAEDEDEVLDFLR